jgi:hypothetical protein
MVSKQRCAAPVGAAARASPGRACRCRLPAEVCHGGRQAPEADHLGHRRPGALPHAHQQLLPRRAGHRVWCVRAWGSRGPQCLRASPAALQLETAMPAPVPGRPAAAAALPGAPGPDPSPDPCARAAPPGVGPPKLPNAPAPALEALPAGPAPVADMLPSTPGLAVLPSDPGL